MISSRLLATVKSAITHSITLNGTDEVLTLSSPPVGSRRIFTLSAWIKVTGASNTVVEIANGSHTLNLLLETGAHQPDLFEFNSPTTHLRELLSSKSFDTGTWHHICYAVDTTQGTAGNRVRGYFDGVATAPGTVTNPTLNYNTLIGNSHNVVISKSSNGLVGKLAYLVCVEGLALPASSFGQTINAAWKPKQYTGAFGTYGFQLLFNQSSSLGQDSSGNGNNFTLANIDSSNQSSDVP
jgi:hypothetical protein